MSEDIKHVLYQCINMIEYIPTDPEIIEEYNFWINWLRNRLQKLINFSIEERVIILKIINKNILLKEDLQHYM